MTRETLQSKLDPRVRPPWVNITYDVEVGGAIEMKELPFVVGVLGHLSGNPEEPLTRLKNRKFVEVDLDNFNDVLAAMKPRLVFPVDDLISGGDSKLDVELKFRHIEDFEPMQLIGQVKPLADLLEKRERLARDLPRLNEDERALATAELAGTDKLLSQQLNLIIHAPAFQKLEASWRGLRYLVSNTMTSQTLKIRVLDVSKKELLKDFDRVVEFDQSSIFKKVYEDEYGTFGGSPYGALIGDYEFSNHPQDINLLEHLSHIAAMAHAPFISAAAPQLFGWDFFSDLAEVRDLAKIFDRTEYAAYQSFRDTEDSRYVGLTLPRILMRLPYTRRPTPDPTFQFAEDLDERGRFLLWGNAAYAFGVCLTNAFAIYHWCAGIRGVEGGGLVTGLPAWTIKSDAGVPMYKCPVEIAVTDRYEMQMTELGFMSLVHCLGTEYAAFFAAPSCNRPKRYDTEAPNANARMATQLQYVMTASRFAHYLKAMTRDMIGRFKTRGEHERFLNQWISRYVGSEDDASSTVRAKFPLREARIDVAEVPGKPGTYQAVMFLRPYFQLDELSVSLRFVVDLPFQAH